jgi:hypothetical protein
MKHSDSLASIAPALVKAINAIEGVKKDASNPHFKSKFATLEAVIEAAHPHLASNGLTVLQGPGLMQGNALTVSTRILHESGEWIETEFAIPMAKQDPQAAGSALTYARRYSLMAVLNMPAVDDDGESAMRLVETITQDQADKLREELEATGSNVSGFLSFFKIERIEALPATRHGEAARMIETKRRAALDGNPFEKDAA